MSAPRRRCESSRKDNFTLSEGPGSRGFGTLRCPFVTICVGQPAVTWIELTSWRRVFHIGNRDGNTIPHSALSRRITPARTFIRGLREQEPRRHEQLS